VPVYRLHPYRRHVEELGAEDRPTHRSLYARMEIEIELELLIYADLILKPG